MIIHHIELYKSFFELDNFWHISFFQIIGKLGVVLFFVLSGFLITSLLLHEKERKGFISFKNFYVRRILKIWPLYYLVIFFGFFIFPYIHFFDIPDKTVFPNVLEHRFPNVFYYLTIFANLGWAIFKDVPYTSQTWSLATEEQFYLFWPVLIVVFRKRLIHAMLTLLIGYWIVKYFLDLSDFAREITSSRRLEIVQRFWHSFNVNCMALGGIFAVLVHQKSHLLKFIFNRYLFIFSFVSVIILMALGINFGFFHYDIYALFFAIIIVNMACNSRYKMTLENRITNYLGSISYGMYMLHLPIITIAIKAGKYFESPYILTYTIAFAGTLFISHFSFKYFENYFLKLKSKFI